VQEVLLVPTGWTGWLFWQHSVSGSVVGVSDMADLDTFNGSAQALAVLVQNDWIFLRTVSSNVPTRMPPTCDHVVSLR
jgi:hypothetical protein